MGGPAVSELSATPTLLAYWPKRVLLMQEEADENVQPISK